MVQQIRPMQARDIDAVVELSLRAWARVFESMRAVMGPRVFERQYPDWRRGQAEAVREVCGSMTVWVAVDDADQPLGFVAAVQRDGGLGEVEMLAVDPAAQGRGLGGALTEHAVDWLRDGGATLAAVGTGGDPGHAPARRTYERAGFIPMPLVRYYRAL